MKLISGTKLLLFLWLLTVLVTGGCGAPKDSAPPEIEGTPAEPPGVEIPPTTANIPARDVLLRGQAAPSGFGAYGYVLFTVRPSPNTQARFRAVCEAYQGSFESVEEFPGVSPSQLMVTFWPLRSKPQASEDCSAWVAGYDFARAAPIAQVISRLGVPGPVLVAWQEPFGPKSSGKDALVLDMSDFSDEDVGRAFLIWKNQLSRDPSVWEDGFEIALVREMFRSFLNTYGEQIVAIVRGSEGK